MAHLIDKDALVAEINKRINDAPINNIGHQRVWAYNDVKDIIDTLEIKEVDLDYIKDELARVVKIYKPSGDFGWGTLYNIATHFFELGLKAQKGE